MTDFDFPSELETLVLCQWAPHEDGFLRADYPNGAGYMRIRGGLVEYWEVCSNGEDVLTEWRELQGSDND